MTNTEWGDGLTGEEMRALKGIVPDDTPVMRINEWRRWETYSYWAYDTPGPYRLPSDSPVYTVRDWNAKHPDERPFVPHCGDTCPVDGDVLVDVLLDEGGVCSREHARTLTWKADDACWDIIGYRIAQPDEAPDEGVGELADTVTLPRMTEAEAVKRFGSFIGYVTVLRELNLIRPTPIEALRTAHPGKSDTDLCVMLLEQRGEG